MAIANDHLNAAQLLREKGAGVNQKKIGGLTALLICRSDGGLESSELAAGRGCLDRMYMGARATVALRFGS